MVKKYQSGFTLIELLVVIAVIGVLATVLLTAINPLEYFNQAKDAKLRKGVSDYAKALVAYRTANAGMYPGVANSPCAANAWVTCLVLDKSVMTATPSASSAVGVSNHPNCSSGNWDSATNREYCFKTDGTNVVVYTLLQGSAYNYGCANNTYFAYYSWHSANEQFATDCLSGSAEPSI